MDIANYVGQIVYVKTTDENVVMGKIVTEHKNQYTGYRLKVFEKNGQNMDLDTFVYADQIKAICILPHDIQQGIELTIEFMPTTNFEDIDYLPSVIEFGRT